MSLPIKTTITGDFASRLQERISKLSGAKAAAKLVVPDELAWWYYQEIGTKPHIIAARNSKTLVYPQGGVLKMATQVQHPGVKAQRIVGRLEESGEFLQAIRAQVQKALEARALDNPQEFQKSAVEATKECKGLIVDSMKAILRGHRAATDPRFPRQAGKLEGRFAHEVFDEQAKVEES